MKLKADLISLVSDIRMISLISVLIVLVGCSRSDCEIQYSDGASYWQINCGGCHTEYLDDRYSEPALVELLNSNTSFMDSFWDQERSEGDPHSLIGKISDCQRENITFFVEEFGRRVQDSTHVPMYSPK